MQRTTKIAPVHRVVSLVVPQSARAASPVRHSTPLLQSCATPTPQCQSPILFHCAPLRSSAAATMEDQQFETSVDVSVSNMQRDLWRHGVDVPDPLTLGTAMLLTYAHDAIPDPPVSPAAPLASAIAARAPADGVDRISLLPDALLRNVVSRLPARDAARTAALATRWRGLWRSVPLAVVDAHILPACVPADHTMPGGEDDLSWAVAVVASRVLDAHPGPFRCVHISRCHMASHQADIERWLEVLAAKGVQELVFFNRPWPIDYPLPRALYGCTSVTRLHLGMCWVPCTAGLPRTACFPYLRELVLDTFVIEERDLHFLIDRSPVLEVLTITTNLTGARVRLISRSLRCVQVSTSAEVHITVVDAPCLERLLMWMILPAVPGESCSRIKIGHAPNLCMLGHWQPGFELEIGNTILKVGTKMSPSTMVPTVKILALESVNDAPSGKVDPKFWEGEEAGCIDCVQRHVKKFVFQEFRGKRSELAFLKFIAERAQVLEKMVVMVASKCFSSADAVNAKLKPLTSAIWASKDCKLIVFKSPTSDGACPVWASKVASDFLCSDPFDLLTTNAELYSGISVLQHSSTL